MAVTFAGVTWNTTAGDKTVTATPAVGDLIVVVAATTGIAAGTTAVADNNSGGAGSYTFLNPPGHVAQGANNTRLGMWVRTATIASGTSTVFTATQASTTGGGLAVYRVTGASGTGASAVRQYGSLDNQAAGTPSITLNDPMVGDHAAVIGAVLTGSNSSANTAPPTSPAFTEDVDLGYNSPTTGLEVVSYAGVSGAQTIAWTAATPSAFCAILIEMNGPAAVLLPYLSMARQGPY